MLVTGKIFRYIIKNAKYTGFKLNRIFDKYLSPLTYSFFLFSFLHTPAYSYIDPGSISVLLQGALAGLAAFAVGISMYWQRIRKKIFGNKASTDEKTEHSSDPKSEE